MWMTDADLRGANLHGVRNWNTCRIKGANVYGVRNAPEFVQWALANGAVSSETPLLEPANKVNR